MFSNYPFLRILVAFIPGILSANYFQIPVWLFYTQFAIVLIAYVGIVKGSPKLHFQLRHLIAALLLFVLFAYANLISWQAQPSHQYSHYSKLITPNINTTVRAQIRDSPKLKGQGYAVEIEVLQLAQQNQFLTTHGKSILYFTKNKFDTTLNIGDEILVTVAFSNAKPVKHNYRFDYNSYLQSKSIEATAFAISAPFAINHQRSIYYYAQLTRRYLHERIEKLFRKKNYADLISALLLGIKDELDPELTKNFGETGTLHVLSVSGLHIGLIYFALRLVFMKLMGSKIRKAISLLFILTALWFYAFITGLTPSITRAAFMISIVLIGEIINRKTNLFNSLAAAAFVLLCFNPQWLYQLSFLLSFFALAGILLLQPLIYSLFFFSNSFLDRTWQLSSASIAAQIATLPICLYTFGNFPNYFLLANLIVIPLISAILYLALISLLFAAIPFFNDCLIFLSELLMDVLFFCMTTFSKLPYTVSSLAISFHECVVITISIALLFYFLVTKRIYILNWGLCCLFVVLVIHAHRNIQLQGRQHLVLLNSKKELALLQKENYQLNYFYTESDDRSVNFIRQFANGHRLEFNTIEFQSKHNEHSAYRIANRSMYILDEQTPKLFTNFPINIDVLLIKNCYYKRLQYYLKFLKPRLVVLTYGISTYQRKKIKQELKSSQQLYFDCKENGDFIWEY